MGQDWGSSPRQQFDWQSPNLNYLGAPFNTDYHPMLPSPMKPGADMVSIKGSLPVHPSLEPPSSRICQANEPQNWFYCLPRFRQAFTPALNSVLKDKLASAPCDSSKVAVTPKVDSGCSQRKFLVFDQSGDQTTLIFSSGIGTPAPCFISLGPKLNNAGTLKREDPSTIENQNMIFGATTSDEFGKNDGDGLQSEMHEDTDELNALLYSDDDSNHSEDDEVTSTGHSPSTMTVHNNQEGFTGSTEEVASSGGSTKKRKLFDGGHCDVPALMDTASSKNSVKNSDYGDDAESRCDNVMNFQTIETCSESSNKKIRRERIWDTVNALQNIIPGGKGKDAIVVLDEAISYLKTLKLKAIALGLDSQ